MPLLRRAAFVTMLAPIVSVACDGSSKPSAAPATTTASQSAPAPAAGTPAGAEAGATSDGSAGTVAGTVAETMRSGGYTYARLSGNGADAWIAAPAILPVEVGDLVTAVISMPMEKFRSRTLNREFELIYFVSNLSRNGETLAPSAAGDNMAMADSHGGSAPSARPAEPTAPVAQAPDGLKVADVWARRQSLSGKRVIVRGRVVKANYEIMGVNWYHLQDGSGAEKDGTHDLTITSDARASVGDVITATGTLTTDKDFGAGYAYDAIVEKASIRE